MTIHPRFGTRFALCCLLGATLFVGDLVLSAGLVTRRASAQERQEATKQATTPVGKALEKVNVGDLAGAVAILEPLAGRSDTSPLAKALLGGLLVQIDRPADALKVLQPLADPANADPAVLYNAGRAALAIGKRQQGEKYLARSVERDPHSIASRELGLIRFHQGRAADGYLLLKPWVESHPQDRQAMLAAGHCAVELRRAPEVEQILSFLPADDAEAMLIRGKLEVLKGNAESAIAMVKPLIASASGPLESQMRLLVADAYLRSGNSAAAVSLLQGKTAGNPLLHLFLARATYQQGDLDAAAKLFASLSDQLLSAKNSALPPGLVALSALEYGRVLLARDDAAGAVPFLQRAAELAPEERQSWQTLGQALLLTGRKQEGEAALARFKEIVANAGEDKWSHVPSQVAYDDPTARKLSEAMNWLSKGEPDKALAAIHQEQELSPNDPRPWLQEVQLLLVAGRKQEAASAADKVVSRFPGTADPLYLRGVTGMALEQLDKAEKDLRQALSVSPQHTAAMSDLAVLLMVQKRSDEAKALLERVLELQPDDKTARANLDRLQEGSKP